MATETITVYDPEGRLAQYLEVEWHGPESRLVVTVEGSKRKRDQFRRDLEAIAAGAAR